MTVLKGRTASPSLLSLLINKYLAEVALGKFYSFYSAYFLQMPVL